GTIPASPSHIINQGSSCHWIHPAITFTVERLESLKVVRPTFVFKVSFHYSKVSSIVRMWDSSRWSPLFTVVIEEFVVLYCSFTDPFLQIQVVKGRIKHALHFRLPASIASSLLPL